MTTLRIWMPSGTDGTGHLVDEAEIRRAAATGRAGTLCGDDILPGSLLAEVTTRCGVCRHRATTTGDGVLGAA